MTAPARSRKDDRWVDEVAVGRALAGQSVGRSLTRGERRVIAERVQRDGGGAARLARVLHCNGPAAARLIEAAERKAGVPVTIDRGLCPAPRHGTEAAYGGQPGCRCPDARAAHTRGNKLRQTGLLPPGLVSTVGVRRRREALGVLGYSLADLAPYFGCTFKGLAQQLEHPRILRSSYRRWVAVYDRLSRLPGPNQRARTYAGQHGWLPAGAWTPETIDDPHALPQPRYRLARAG